MLLMAAQMEIGKLWRDGGGEFSDLNLGRVSQRELKNGRMAKIWPRWPTIILPVSKYKITFPNLSRLRKLVKLAIYIGRRGKNSHRNSPNGQLWHP